MMKILICPDSFKGTLSSEEASEAIRRGVARVNPEAKVECIPLGDGGEGTAGAICNALRNKWDMETVEVSTLDPLHRPITAPFHIVGNCMAIIETASASGLTLLTPEERNVMEADTYGTGLLIADAYRKGIKNIIICLGGSATCDGGYGAYRALREVNQEFGFPINGILLPDARFTLLCDVKNPLCGPNGAAKVFGPQKGADEKQVLLLEDRNLLLAEKYKSVKNVSLEDMPYAGAAGGLAGMFMACCKSTAVDGIEEVLNFHQFDKRIADADLIITGEGRIDDTTFSGKALSGIMERCKKHKKPVAAIGGQVKNDIAPWKKGFDFLVQATPEDALIRGNLNPDECSFWIEEAAAQILKNYINSI